MKKNTFLLIVFALLFGSISAQNGPIQLDSKARTTVVENLCDALKKYYIDLDTGINMATYVKKKLNNKEYEGIANPNEFASRLTTDLRSIYKDKHLEINYDPQMEKVLTNKSGENVSSMQQSNLENERQQNFGFKKVEILKGNIGYVYFDGFVDVNASSKETVSNVFSFLKNTNALVIDLRNNGGGSPDMVKYICSYFFKDRTHINTSYKRVFDKTVEYWTEPIANVGNFCSMPIYVLVSNRTFSAAEELSYDLKSLHRATIIGETTGGGAHAVTAGPIEYGFIATIPVARSINPVTGKDWEGVGVMPDVAISEDKALDAAILSYYDFQLNTLKDPASIRTIKWKRDVFNAKLHTFPIDNATMETYVGNYGGRAVSVENGILYFTGMDGKKNKLIAIDKTTFFTEDRDRIKIEFLPDPTGFVKEFAFVFDDGRVDKLQRTN
jgi:hypothetical protein